MKSEQVTQAWEFYRDNCQGFKEPMRREFRKLDEHVSNIEAENAKLRAENKNLIANYEMLRESYMDSKQACEHLFTELKRYKSLLRAKLPERELMLIEEIKKLREACASLYEFAMSEYPDGTELNFADLMRELGIEVPE